MCLYHSLKDADGMANSVAPDQTAPALFAQAYLILSVRKLRIITVPKLFNVWHLNSLKSE